MEDKTCPTCGAKTVKYKHRLNYSLIQALRKCAKYKIAALTDLELTKSQYTNFQKLKYWKLVTSVDKTKGYWSVTPLGRDFLRGDLRIHRTAVSYRGAVHSYEGDMVYVSQIHEKTYKQRQEYIQDSGLAR